MRIRPHVHTLVNVLFLIGACLAVDQDTVAKAPHAAEDVEVTILSSNLADGSTVGEWGFSALVQVDGQCVLFDTGYYADTVLRNIAVLDVDLSCVTDIVLSHWHPDHMGGLVALFENARMKNPTSMQRVHVAEGFFNSRRSANGSSNTEQNGMIDTRKKLESKGVEFRVYSEPTEILPSIWITGPVKRTHAEKTYGNSIDVKIDGEWVVDHVPDSQGLTIVTPEGPIVLLGCGHSGSVNLLEQVQRDIQDHSVHALMGGMHLFSATEETLDWTANKLVDIGVQNLMAGHCTGIEPMFRLREGLNLNRETAVIGAVGSRFVLGEGIHPTDIAQ
ncbi:MAG: 7,8-dihydropterin-6-yl-methyl-4-(beta-D-ribofuranosyl)aminobenzene 5'-phosphate synthase [Woeseiaceae bacterium]|jgi:7,8-dihydropterin-6-yl-methyl-4-(beta-D-ribofuranosyl)aminobenzene 5'-phosphate synthase